MALTAKAICPGLTHGVGRAMALKRGLIPHFVHVCVHEGSRVGAGGQSGL